MIKIRSQLRYVFIVCVLFVACSPRQKTESKIPVANNQVTLIFENIPAEWRSEETNCMVLSETEYVDDNFISHRFTPDPSKLFDTLTITTNRNVVELTHTYKTVDEFSYLFHKGDTAIIRYNDKTPVVEVVNRETKSFDLNYDLLKRERLTPNDFPAFIKFQQPIVFADYTNGFNGAEERAFNAAVKNFILEMGKELNLLDSLQKHELISDEIANFYKTQLLYRQINLKLQSQIGSHSVKPLYKKFTPEDFTIRMEYYQELGWISGGNLIDSKNDSLLYFSYYNDLSNWIYFQYFSRKVGRIKSTNSVNNITTAGSNIADYLTLADTIYTSILLSEHAKNLLLFKNIQNIIENCSIDETRQAFNKFENRVKDTVLVNYVRNKYSLDDELVDAANDMRLVSTNCEYLTYNELIAKHSGNVIYIDFWGSYCTPCINQFPFATTLKKLYDGQKLVQIYISAEPDQEQWERACTKYGLQAESYFVVNRYTSKQLESMNINYFPQYLLYDKNGTLVSESSPRPGDKELIALLDSCLAKQ
ncbi:thioredoxin-like domain-containing protein [Draconibacterium sp. IB214405]|uniref:TlpA family protein disulfide reductase n=1 Tax=Draconibacterium sp. IB214405 TaxID=3097352 RepID=UPI002A0D058E|nr:thioredoxin-like domain-containing protein [Draconibacterium sp. IB214405]MDX8340823.1 thioredoxin-like domain-containing protein [Draconibacterium sp. IB214405]